MYLATDYIHPYRGVIGVRSRCRIRLYLPQDDQDAAVIIQHFRLPSPPVWIEHRPQEEPAGGQEEAFDLVIFDHHEVKGTLQGGNLHQEIGQSTRMQLDRTSVESLVGHEV